MPYDPKQCACSLAIKLVGDGCQHCNPGLTIELLEEQVAELKAEIETLRLTDEEREAVELAYSRLTADTHYATIAATLRGLLERTQCQK